MRTERLKRRLTLAARTLGNSLATGLLYTALPGAAHAQIAVDGVFDEPEWADAVRCEDWRRIEPYSLDEPRYANQVRLLSTEDGLAVAFIIDHPPGERRVKPRTPRDSETLIGESVGLVVDFDATGQVGYEFSVALGGGVRDGLVLNQNEFDRDWDGEWHHAVRETEEQWFVEMLIPWSTVSMGRTRSERRTIGVFANRYLYDRNERFACPGISLSTPAFLADLQRIEITQHRAAARLDVVPYGSWIADRVAGTSELKAGADLVWKPSQSLWLAATLNPDFGQVESDELVVDFSAIETVFTDKRPFFTENQGIFDLRTPANGQLVYTRRIGAAPDDGSARSSEIDAALKLSGRAGRLIYGAFAAQEDGYSADRGRLFGVTRLALPLARGRIGHLATWADRPYLGRTALVNAVDFEWTPNDWWRLAGQAMRSDLDVEPRAGPSAPDPGGDAGSLDGHAAWLQSDFNRSAPVTHTLKLLYMDDRFDMNDLGYMERNALRQIEWETNRRVAASAEAGRVSGETQRLYLAYRENADGERLPSRIQVSRDVRYANAWRGYQELRYIPSGIDDLLSRGNGPVALDDRIGVYFDVNSPRLGNWQYLLGGYLFQQGVEDYSARLQLGVTWFPMEDLTLRFDVLPQWSEDWLLWEPAEVRVLQDRPVTRNLFGAYRARRLDTDLRVDWIPAPRHELRLRWQWIGVEAEPRAAYRTAADGRLVRSDDVIAPFAVNNLGLQIRYRFEIGPLSDLFVVYGRGGLAQHAGEARRLGTLLGDIDDLRDAEQFLVKIRYRL